MNVVNCNGDTPLHLACSHGKLDKAKLLHRSRSKFKITPLSMMIKSEEFLDYLCEGHHCDFDELRKYGEIPEKYV